MISRAIVEIFSHPALYDARAFRGGTALYKLHLKPAVAYCLEEFPLPFPLVVNVVFS